MHRTLQSRASTTKSGGMRQPKRPSNDFVQTTLCSVVLVVPPWPVVHCNLGDGGPFSQHLTYFTYLTYLIRVSQTPHYNSHRLKGPLSVELQWAVHPHHTTLRASARVTPTLEFKICTLVRYHNAYLRNGRSLLSSKRNKSIYVLFILVTRFVQRAPVRTNRCGLMSHPMLLYSKKACK